MPIEQLNLQISRPLYGSEGSMDLEVSLSIEKGSTLAITGPSGAGKTTLLKSIAGLTTLKTGKIIAGNQIWYSCEEKINVPPQKRNVGFVFQDYALFPHLTVRENLIFALKKSADKSIVDRILTDTGLNLLSDRKPAFLSGGQQQRVGIARALAGTPDLLLLDEPMSSLDSGLRLEIQDILKSYHKQHGIIMIIVTHDLPEIFKMADTVAIMKHGKIVKIGAPNSLYYPDVADYEKFVKFGEVLSIQLDHDLLHVRVKIDANIREISMPANTSSIPKPGEYIALPYVIDTSQISIVKSPNR